MSDQKWWLFYSKKCPHCIKFIELASSIEEISNKISQVEVEANRDRLPQWLKSVPTLQMDNEILHGPELLKWIKEKTKKDLEPSPLSGGIGSGLNTNPYSSLDGKNDSFKTFSMIGSRNGSEGINESTSKAVNTTEGMDMQKLQAARSADIRGLVTNN